MPHCLKRFPQLAVHTLRCLGLLFALLGPVSWALAGGAQYVYDELGRVVGVVSGDGHMETYAYDADGNIQRVALTTASSLAIVNFSPKLGGEGTVVKLQGIGFDPVTTNNTVRFNGVAANVTHAGTTQLTVKVPSGASTGPITVSNSKGTASSQTNFVSDAALMPPLISGFAPQMGVLGSAVVISGRGFMPAAANNAVHMGGVSIPVVSAESSVLTVQANGSGKLSVSTPYGSATSSTDFFAIPGDIPVAQVGYSGRLVADAAPTSLALSTSQKAAVFILDGNAGESFGLGIQPLQSPSLGASASIRLSLYGVNGVLVTSCDMTGPSGNCDLGVLPATGTYTLALVNRNPGSDLNASVYLSSDWVTTFNADSPRTFTANRPGSNARFGFTLPEPRHQTLIWSGSTFAGGTVFLRDASGRPVTNGAQVPYNASFNNGAAAAGSLNFGLLPAGTYSVVIVPNNGAGAIALAMIPDITGEIVVDGAATAVNLAPGKGGGYSFHNTVANQAFGLVLANLSTGATMGPTNGKISMSLHGPQGGKALASCLLSANNESCNFGPLGTGVHLLRIATAEGGVTGNLSLLSDLAAGVLSVNGASRTATTTRAGQNAFFTFSAEADQSYFLQWTGVTVPAAALKVRNPAFGVLASGSMNANAGGMAAFKAATSGIHTVWIDPASFGTGSATLQLSLAQGGAVGSIAIDGEPTVASLEPNKQGRYVFNLPEGKHVGFAFGPVQTDPPNGTVTVSLERIGATSTSSSFPIDCEGGNVIGADGLDCKLGGSLVSGNFALVLTPGQPNTQAGTTITVSSEAVAAPLELETPTLLTTTRPGQNSSATFNAVAGQRYHLSWVNSTLPDGDGSLRVIMGAIEYGTAVAKMNSATGSLEFTPFLTGPHRVLFDPDKLRTGSVSVTLRALPPDATGTLTVDGVSTSATLEPYQRGRYTFQGISGQRLGLGVSAVSTNPPDGLLIAELEYLVGSSSIQSGMTQPCVGSSGLACNISLVMTGTYAVTLKQGQAGTSANATLTLSNDALAPTMQLGSPTTLTTTRPGQNARVSFTPVAGQKYTLSWAQSTLMGGDGSLQIWRNGSSSIVASANLNNATGSFHFTPVASGVHEVFLDPQPGEAGSITVTVRTAQANQAPVAAFALPAQTVMQGATLSYTLPVGAFTDPDEGDTLSYAARMADGQALPAWLTFNAATRTFQGTPAVGAGTLNVVVIATDTSGATVSSGFSLTVRPANRAPTVTTALSNATATENVAWSYTAPANTFADLDAGDTLSYTARQSSGQALPAWLSFNATSRAFQGTPAVGSGTLNLVVVATDTFGASVSSGFSLTVRPANRAPTVAAALSNATATENVAWTYTVPANTFTDIDEGDTLSYTAGLVNGQALPAWLSFNSTSRTFQGVPAAGSGTLHLVVVATDTSGASVSSPFSLTIHVLAGGGDQNRAPVVGLPLADHAIPRNMPSVYGLPEGAFTDPDTGDTLTYAVTLLDGSNLPSWVMFDSATRTLRAAGQSATVARLQVRVTATDAAGAQVSSPLTLHITPDGTLPIETDDNLYLSEGQRHASLGGEGESFIFGNALDNQLAGNDAANEIYGFDGQDVLIGGRGNDILRGGTGSDTYIFNMGDGHDTIDDIDHSGSQTDQDTLRLGEGLTQAGLEVTLAGADVVLRWAGNSSDSVTIHWGTFGVTYRVDRVVFADGTVLSMEDLRARMQTLAMLGTDGDDWIDGTDRADTIAGGRGNDILRGGTGSDTYIFNMGDGHDTIDDIDHSGSQTDQDTLRLGEGLTQAGLEVTLAGADVVLRWAGNSSDSVTIHLGTFGVTYRVDRVVFADGTVLSMEDLRARMQTLAMLGTDGDDWIDGTDLADTIAGGRGNDTLVGGTGSDTYIFNVGDGHDTIDDIDHSGNQTDQDTLRLGEGLTHAGLEVTRVGIDVVLRWAGNANDSVTIIYGIYGVTYRIERVVFADGTVLSMEDLRARALPGHEW